MLDNQIRTALTGAVDSAIAKAHHLVLIEAVHDADVFQAAISAHLTLQGQAVVTVLPGMDGVDVFDVALTADLERTAFIIPRFEEFMADPDCAAMLDTIRGEWVGRATVFGFVDSAEYVERFNLKDSIRIGTATVSSGHNDQPYNGWSSWASLAKDVGVLVAEITG
jgi:hypothetical protein